MAIEKTILHPQGDKETELYPKTSVDQVEGLEMTIENMLEKPNRPDINDGVMIFRQNTDVDLLPYTANEDAYTLMFRGSNGTAKIITLADDEGTPEDIVNRGYVNIKISNFNITNGEGEFSLQQRVIANETEGYYPNVAKGPRSIALGHNSTTYGPNSFASGAGTVANGYNSHTEGLETRANSNNDHAEGQWTLAMGQSSHAEGAAYATGNTQDTIIQWTIASGFASHAEGHGTQASGTGSHSEGHLTQATQKAAHAEGGETKATRGYAHAGGYGSEANGARSFVHGERVVSNYNDQFVIGKYNRNSSANIFEIGYGTADNNRQNFFEVTVDGTARVYGKPYSPTDVVRKQELDALKEELIAMINALRQ